MTSPSISEVLSQTLFVGNLAAAESVKELKQRSITHILCVTSESCRRFPESFTYLVLDIYDDHSQSIIDLFDKAHQFIGGSSHLPRSPGRIFFGSHCIFSFHARWMTESDRIFSFLRSDSAKDKGGVAFLHCRFAIS
jgi:hypothetical protein